jgi:VanZ family protein
VTIRTWRIALVVWLILIFLFSSSLFSAENTEKVLVFDLLNYVVRKCSHMVEYAILVYLWFRSLCVVRERFFSSVILSMVLSVLYAASDEWHQSFVPSRDGTVTDVIWDATGAVFMGLFLWYVYQRGADAMKRTVLGVVADEGVYNT